MRYRPLVTMIAVVWSAAGCSALRLERAEPSGPAPSVEVPSPIAEAPSATSGGSASANADDEASVRRVIEKIYATERRCFSDYPNCDASAFEALLTGDALAHATERTAVDQDANKTASGAETWQFEFDGVVASEDVALVTGCASNQVVLYNADGSVDDDTFWSAIGIWRLVLVDGQWFGADFAVLESASGVDNDLCAAEQMQA